MGDPQKHYAYTAAGLLNTAILGSIPQHRSAHLDAQTSPVVVTANNGNILNRSHFDPYGVETPLFGVRDQGISFQGYWSGVELEEAGNLLSAARLYVPGLGVFGERDPKEGSSLNPVTFNPYLLGQGNPLFWTDPDGRESWNRELAWRTDLLRATPPQESVLRQNLAGLEADRVATSEDMAPLSGVASSVGKAAIGLGILGASVLYSIPEGLGSPDFGARQTVRDGLYAIAHPISSGREQFDHKMRFSQDLDAAGRHSEATALRAEAHTDLALLAIGLRGGMKYVGGKLDSMAPKSFGLGRSLMRS